MSSPLCAAVMLTLISAVAALRSGGGGSSGGGNSGVDDSTFDAPPLEVATVVVCSVLVLATIVLFGFSLRALFYKGARLPAAGVVLALIVEGITNALEVALVVTSYTINDTGLPSISMIALLHLRVASTLFYGFTDVVIFVAIALVLRNRYLPIHSSSPGLIWFTSMAFFLPIMMIVFFTAQNGIAEAVLVAAFGFTISDSEVESRLRTANNLIFGFIAFQILGTIFLAISTFLVKARTKNDRVMALTLFAIIPLLSLYSLARLISDVLQIVLPESESFTLDVSFALDFSTALVYGVLHTAILSVLVFLIRRPHLWDTQPLSMQNAPLTQGTPLTQGAPLQTTPIQDASASQFFVMGAPPGQGTPPAGGPTSSQMFVYSTPPGGQYPGQWGYIQQPQELQTDYPQPQQYAYVSVSPIQTLGTSAPATNMTQTSPTPLV